MVGPDQYINGVSTAHQHFPNNRLKWGERAPIQRLPARKAGKGLRESEESPFTQWRFSVMRKLIPVVGPLLAAVLAMVPILGAILAAVVA